MFSLALLVGGCAHVSEFVHNGFKLGPNHARPPAPLANSWIDASDPQVKSVPADISQWWNAFGDPVLNDLVKLAYEQNVNLRIAGTRVLEARAQRAVAVGTLFPQQQTATGSIQHTVTGVNQTSITEYKANLNASWELDFWGKFRRTIESADDLVDASVDDYDNVLVTLIGDVAATYVQYRIFEQQLVYARQNVELQTGSLKIATERWKAGQTDELGVVQASSLLDQLEATVPALEIALRQANNQLCILLGTPPTELADMLGKAPIPQAPSEVVVGIPADLIRRRPDLRAAERLVAAQNAQIGVAKADFFPAFFISGTIGVEAHDLDKPIGWQSFGTRAISPSFQWPILNYGRILNNVRLQDFKTQELVAVYQQKVLAAGREAENGIISFLRSKEITENLVDSVKAAERSVSLTNTQFRAGVIDYTPVFVAEQFLSQQQNLLAQAQGDIALGLISVYRALGGGWELRLADANASDCVGASASAAPAVLAVEPIAVDLGDASVGELDDAAVRILVPVAASDQRPGNSATRK